MSETQAVQFRRAEVAAEYRSDLLDYDAAVERLTQLGMSREEASRYLLPLSQRLR